MTPPRYSRPNTPAPTLAFLLLFGSRKETKTLTNPKSCMYILYISDTLLCEPRMPQDPVTPSYASAGVLAALGAATFALGCQTAALHAYRTMKDPTPDKWSARDASAERPRN